MEDETTPGSTPAPEAPAAPEPTPPPAPVPGGLEDAPFMTPEDAFRFDPFSGESEPTPAPTPAPAPAAAPAAPAPAASVPPAPTPPVQAGSPVQSGSELDQVLRTLAETQRTVMELVARQQTPAAPTTPTAPTQPEVPQYEFNLTDDMDKLLLSEDPTDRRRALLMMAQGVAQSVHRRVREEYRQHFTDAIGKYEKTFNGRLSAIGSAQRIYNDFYGTYPQLQKEELLPVVQAVTGQVTKEMGNSWSPQIRDEIARRVFTVLTSVQPPQAEPRSPAPTPPPARMPRPPVMRGMTTRPAAPAPPAPGSQEQHMQDVLFAGFEL